MKLSVVGAVLNNKPLDEALSYLHKMGVDGLEVGCGGFPGKAHCDPEILLHDDKKLNQFLDCFKKHDMEISALSTHGNAVHPEPATAKRFHDDFVNAVLLAEKIGVKRIITFSGCPGGCKDDKTPNWVTCPWPDDFLHILDYQWNDVLLPYWRKMGQFAREHGVEKIAFEMHPGFCVYNPETMLRIRGEVGDILGANLDPSHLYWQGMDMEEVIKKLGSAIYYFHAKDTKIDRGNTAVNGVLDTKHYSDALHRSWVFRTVGYGHDKMEWNSIISALRTVGYDDYISIEHEDGLMAGEEGLGKAIRFMQDVLIYQKTGDMFWA